MKAAWAPGVETPVIGDTGPSALSEPQAASLGHVKKV